MRRVIRKRIRRQGDGVDLAADLNVQIDVNVGRSTVPASARPRTSETERPEPPDPPSENPEDDTGEEP